MIPYGRQDIDDDDRAAVDAVLRSDFLTQGPAPQRFEAALSAACGAAHAVAVNSATSALHLACLALGLKPGGLVWTSPITFVASANCALYCGARVDFVDIDPRSFNMCPEALTRKLEAAAKANALPDIIIPVHMAGQSCDMAAISAAARRYGVRIIEDASHAVGGTYRGAPVGNCAFSEITVLSFHPVKIITTGEGGAALTQDAVLARRMALLRTHGITRDSAEMTAPPDGPWAYEQIALGFNYRMTDIQAALGVSQMRRIGDFLERRRALAARYDAALAGLKLTVPWRMPEAESAWHLYVIRLDLARLSITHRAAFEALRASGVGVNLHYIPVYRQPYYRALGFAPGYCPEAERYYAEAISLPLFPALSAGDQARVIEAAHRLLG